MTFEGRKAHYTIMTKSELRKARKEAIAVGLPLTGELALSGNRGSKATPTEMRSETKRKYPIRRFASRAEQHGRYIDCGPSNWDDR